MDGKCVFGADILLPNDSVDYEKWAVVAVDQYTSEPEYWCRTEEIVGDAPSALKITLPEIYLSESECRIPQMQQNMRRYLETGVLTQRVKNGYVLVERQTESGVRVGLAVCIDLEQYDYSAGAQSLIRATEGTVIERVPPRVKIRSGAELELPHVLMLLDDAKMRAVEPAYEARDTLEKLYDFELMQGGGHLRGWKIEGEAKAKIDCALDEILEESGSLFLAVGDGNHSLAAARAYWLEIRETLTEAERSLHPARYALAEIENLHSPAIRFEPIHRIVTGVNPEAMIAEYEEYLTEIGEKAVSGDALTLVWRGNEKKYGFTHHPLKQLQAFLDAYLLRNPRAKIDYIHGDAALRRLAAQENALGWMPCAFEKADFFPFIRKYGALPRKTFSMGHAREKRYYLEARRITASK